MECLSEFQQKQENLSLWLKIRKRKVRNYFQPKTPSVGCKTRCLVFTNHSHCVPDLVSTQEEADTCMLLHTKFEDDRNNHK